MLTVYQLARAKACWQEDKGHWNSLACKATPGQQMTLGAIRKEGLEPITSFTARADRKVVALLLSYI